LWLEALRAKESNRPVIDEYDAPVTAFLPKSLELSQVMAEMMKPFYEMVKKRGRFFHKVFVTGAPPKFSSVRAYFSTLYGFTEVEDLLPHSIHKRTSNPIRLHCSCPFHFRTLLPVNESPRPSNQATSSRVLRYWLVVIIVVVVVVVLTTIVWLLLVAART
jgi:hypothetical protein